ncbi:helix-turn-helix domain-containing protein [Mesorhizobium sp. GbtcB19]|uniref:helix-turn-helix domain-containing protein n=1 Tax=Mesorhizobium sp. GbtcB19 TaxID=2824764 RepID=UPI001C30DD87|nr:helix-turn-helix domain-containing protein [Mesorhizobium sp. GbtcB19]
MTQTIRRAPSRVSLSIDPGNAREFDLWQSTYSSLYEMNAESAASRASFRAGLTSFNLANVVIIEGYSSAETLKRTGRTIAQSSIDHIGVVVRLEGGFGLDIEGRAAEVHTGDVCFLDMTRPSALRASDYRSLTLVLPRNLLASQIADLDGLHGRILPKASPLNAMLTGHMRLLYAQAPSLDLPDAHAAARGAAALVAAFAGASADGRDMIAQAAASASLQACRRMIDANLHDRSLGPDLLCGKLGISRAKLYRIFEPLGGVRLYIQQRRLMRAYQIIVDPAQVRERISAIALRCGFSNVPAFNRAFRRAHGMSPSELRFASISAGRENIELTGDRAFRTIQRWLHGMDAVAA